ncbi:hypothetical protein L1887_01632 [Cichorium endivia]|nr:hypothetical protein L1887_01632 [Cichorium endivia]
MGVELMKEYGGIVMRGCQRLASRHPLLVFMSLVLIWIYRSFPPLFALLVDALPVIASTTVLLGTLLFFGHSNAPEIQKEGKPYNHTIHNLKFRVMGETEIDCRGVKPERRGKACRKKARVVHRVNTNDNNHILETDKLAKSGAGNQKEKIVLVNCCTQFQPSDANDGAYRNEDDKGWETGSELVESSSPTASMTDIFPMLDELHQLHGYLEVPQHADMSNISTDAESGNSEENNQGDMQVKHYEEKEEEKQKNLMNPSDPPCDSNANVIGSTSILMPSKSPSDLSSDPSRQESGNIDSVPSKPNTELSHHHVSFEVGPSTLVASKEGKEGHNSGPHFVPEPETSDATNYSSMHRQVDEVSDSNMSSTPDKESVGSLLVEDDSTSIKKDIHTKSVGSDHYEDEPSQKADLISVKEGSYKDDSTSIKKGSYTESVGSSHYEDDPSRVDDSISLKEGFHSQSVGSSHHEDDPSREGDSISVKEGFHSQSVGSSHYEDNPSREDDPISVKEGFHSQSVGSSHHEDDPSREDDSISVKEGFHSQSVGSSHYDNPSREDDSISVKEGFHSQSVGSSHHEDDPSREDDSISVKEGFHSQSVGSSTYEDNPSREDDSISVKEGFHSQSVGSSHHEDDPSREDDSISVKEGFHSQSVGSSHYEDNPSREDDSISVKEGFHSQSVGSSHYEDNPSREDDSISVKEGFHSQSVGSSHYEDDPSREDDSILVKEGFHSQSVGLSHYEDDPSREDDSSSVKEGYYEDDSISIKGGYYTESLASAYTEDDPSREADSCSVKEGYYASEISDYHSQRSVSSDDDDTVNLRHNSRPYEVKKNGGGETGYQGKSRSELSSPPFSDVTDHGDDEEEDYRSTIMPLMSHSTDQKIQEQGKETSLNTNSASTPEAVDSTSVHDFESDSDHKQDDQSPKSEHDAADSSVHASESDSTVSKPNEGLLPQTFNQVQQGLTSWFKWKA